jgi:hypothetical protein
MPDEPHDEDLGNLDDALFGEGSAPPPPSRPSSGPGDDLDWLDEGADSSLPELPPLSAEQDDDELFFGPRDLEPIGAPTAPPASDPDAEGPIVDAAMFGTTAAAAGMAATPTRRELHGRPPGHDRGKRVVVALLVGGLVLLVGAGVVAFASGSDTGKETQVKVVGTDLPSTTVTTRPATTAPATVAPTEPPTTAKPATAGTVAPARTNPPVQATDPPPPPPTDAPTTSPPDTTPPTTTTNVCVGTDCHL